MLPRIVYFVPEFPALTSGVVHSTVLAEAAFLVRKGWSCLFVGSEMTPATAREAEAAIPASYGVPARIFSGLAERRTAVARLAGFRAVAREALPAIRTFQPTHLWTEFFMVVPQARRLARKTGATLVFDVPAIWCEEQAMRIGRGVLFRLLQALEYRRIGGCARLAGVSQRLSQAVELHTGRRDMVVMPCCFDAELFQFDPQARARIRPELGFADHEHVLCYCGGLSAWQRVRDILTLCHELSKRDSAIKFLFIAQATAEVTKAAAEIGLDSDRLVVRGCRPREVPQYLSAADSGIVMRHDTPVNNVASPIKIGEYLGCGLPVLLTRGIGDYSAALPAAGVGLLLEESGDCAGQVLEYVRQSNYAALCTRAAEFARTHLSWEAQWPSLQRLFGAE